MSVQALDALILDRLIEAQLCMRYLHVRNVRPSQTSTFWPDVEPGEQERWEVVKQQILAGIKPKDMLKAKASHPSSAAISRMEETWQWVSEIQNQDARKAVSIKVFAWVHKVSTSSLAKGMDIHRVTLNRRYERGLEEIRVNLCKLTVLPNDADEDLVHQFRPKSAIQNSNIAANAA